MSNTARKLRQPGTPAEDALWQALRNRRLSGLKFRRQHPIAHRFIADFYCAEHGLIVEVDGTIHDIPEQQQYDTYRTEFLTARGLTVIRFTNEQVLTQINAVCMAILRTIEKTPAPRE